MGKVPFYQVKYFAQIEGCDESGRNNFIKTDSLAGTDNTTFGNRKHDGTIGKGPSTGSGVTAGNDGSAGTGPGGGTGSGGTNANFNSTLEYYKFNSRDITKDVSNFTYFGISLAILIFSIYFFSTTSRLLRKKIDNAIQESFADTILYIIALFFVFSWVALIIYVKGNIDYIFEDMVLYPKQYILGILLAAFILSITSIYRHVLLISLFSKEETSFEKQKNYKKTIITLAFTAINLGGSVITILKAFQ